MTKGEMFMLFAAAAILLRRRVEWDDEWVWPVPVARINGVDYPPAVSQESKQGAHNGVDVMYRRRSPSDLAARYRPGTPDGSRNYFAPSTTPILAARAGKVYQVARKDNGWAVRLDHGHTVNGPLTSLYLHLSSVIVAKGQAVAAGQPLGVMGFSPEDPERLRHLHFEVHHGELGSHVAVSPDDAMASWPTVPGVFVP